MLSTDRSVVLGLVALLIDSASAGWQVQCFSRLFDQRLDPIVNPGSISAHTHVITGGNGFAADMDYAMARASSCLTCNVREDLSNYWTPKLYFQAANGSFIDVPIQGDNQYGLMGGMAIYYNDEPYNGEKVYAFPENFRMLAGDTFKRSESEDFTGQAVRMECVDAGGNVKYAGLPDRKCSLGIVAELIMPSCWDGVNATSPDHKSHVSYPKDAVEGGQCPDTHSYRLMAMTYKVTYRTDVFQDMWPGDKNPFVFANGDATGYGFHGDFVNGWDVDVLETAANNCRGTLVPNGNRCEPGYTGTDKIFSHMTDQGEAFNCKLPAVIDEPVKGVLPALPGCNPVTYGPDPAPKAPTCNGETPGTSQPAGSAPSSTSSSPSQSTTQSTVITSPTPSTGSGNYADMTSKGYSYLGCGSDDPASRTFNDLWVGLSDMTVEKCIDFCKAEGYSYAGAEWGSECFCGNTLAADRAPKAGSSVNCATTCNGDSSQICGGDRAMSLYQVCSSGDVCINSPVSRVKRHLAAHLRSWNGNH